MQQQSSADVDVSLGPAQLTPEEELALCRRIKPEVLRYYLERKSVRLGTKRMLALRARLKTETDLEVLRSEPALALVIVALRDGLMVDAWGPAWGRVELYPGLQELSTGLSTGSRPDESCPQAPVDMSIGGPLIAIPEPGQPTARPGVSIAQPAGAEQGRIGNMRTAGRRRNAPQIVRAETPAPSADLVWQPLRCYGVRLASALVAAEVTIQILARRVDATRAEILEAVSPGRDWTSLLERVAEVLHVRPWELAPWHYGRWMRAPPPEAVRGTVPVD